MRISRYFKMGLPHIKWRSFFVHNCLFMSIKNIERHRKNEAREVIDNIIPNMT